MWKCLVVSKERHLVLDFSTEESFGPYKQTGKEEESGMAGTRRVLVCGHSPESGL